MTSRVLGLIRDQVLAYFFGAGDAMDAFRIAFRLPNVLRDLFAEGALSAALVPDVYARARDGRQNRRVAAGVERHHRPSADFRRRRRRGHRCSPSRSCSCTPRGFATCPGKLELTIRLTRIMFPFLAMVATAAVMMAMLNALHRFFIPALSPAMFNVATIVCAVVAVPLSPHLGHRAHRRDCRGHAARRPGADRCCNGRRCGARGFGIEPVLDVRDPWLREIGRLMVPGVAGLAAVQINLLVNSWLAAGLGTGAVSWLDYAFRLMYMPIGLFGISIATASLPTISGHAADRNDPGIRRAVSSGLRMMLMLNVPATVGLLVLATPIVRLIFERGRFTPADTAATAAALMCYAPGLIGYSAVKLVSPSFYALGNSRIPVIASAASVAFNIALNLILVRSLGHRGLALGTAAAALLNAGLLLVLLRARLGGLEGRRLLVASVKISLASIGDGVRGVLCRTRPAHSVRRRLTLIAQAVRVFGAIGIGMGVLAHLRAPAADRGIHAAQAPACRPC